MAGASVFHGVEGYGASRQLHVSRILPLSGDLSVAVVVVDSPEQIDAFVPLVQHLVTDGLITMEDLRAVGHPARREDAATEGGTTADGHPGMLRWLGHRGCRAEVGVR